VRKLKLILTISLSAAALVAPSFAAPAYAQYYQQGDEYIDEDVDGKDGDYEDRDRAYDDYDQRDEAPEPDEPYYQGDSGRGDDGRLYCRRSDGTTGTIVGGGAGALVGRGIDRRGERVTGTIIGGVVGALLGRAIERDARCR
jgi:hypothetical protein